MMITSSFFQFFFDRRGKDAERRAESRAISAVYNIITLYNQSFKWLQAGFCIFLGCGGQKNRMIFPGKKGKSPLLFVYRSL